jgi:hypothetical protein
MKLKELHEESAVTIKALAAAVKEKFKNYETEYQGDLLIGDYKIDSLEGCPKEVDGTFSVSSNRLTSLKDGPTDVNGDYYCDNNSLKSLEGSPERINGGGFNCAKNWMTTLKGGPSYVRGDFSCERNNLTNFEGFPAKIGGSLYAHSNKFTSLEGIHLQIKSIGYHKAGWSVARFDVNPIISHVLGLLLIDNLSAVALDNKLVADIINKYLKGSRDVIDCQNELMDAGLDEYAQL